jgi:superfamily II DNA helicase RecQ
MGMDKELEEREKERLKQMTFYSTTSGCLRAFILRYFGEKAPASCGNCSSCIGKTRLSKVPAGKEAVIEPEESCFTALRLLRNQLSMAQKTPAYVVFTDATLRDMVSRQPMSEEEFLEVSGVGEEKNRRYGKLFIDLIMRYQQKRANLGALTAQDASQLAQEVFNTHRPWTDSEIVRLKAGIAQGMSSLALAKAHERPEAAILRMLRELDQ